MTRPNKSIYTSADMSNYAEILDASNAMRSSSNPNKPKSSRSEKYREIIRPIREKRGEMLGPSRTGSAIGSAICSAIILPSDPNELIEMLTLRISGLKAGNTGVRNEAVAICDELLRQGILDRDGYKAIQLLLTK